ncbi:MAG: sulfite exporter TauE/SafE family protein [Cyclobacteriaceae bacterium]|nr:sulfite exporter TauE/SafE family protein [Cyclobacteriaceae bacterium]
MDLFEGIIIVIVGFISGFLNTVAGGGSLIALPVLIFMGLPPAVANGTNRIAIFSQNIVAVAGFKSRGVTAFPYSLWLGISALFGAIIGAKIAVDISGELFNRILAVVLILAVLYPLIEHRRQPGTTVPERMSGKFQVIGVAAFFFIGIYGGFIQAGVGFIIISALTIINRFTLVKTNSAKVFVIMVYTVSALVIFIVEDKIVWLFGIVLAVSSSAGSWIGSRLSVKKGDNWIRGFIIVTVIGLAVKLWFFDR